MLEKGLNKCRCMYFGRMMDGDYDDSKLYEGDLGRHVVVNHDVF